MKTHLQKVLCFGESMIKICLANIEEVNDGAERFVLVLSSMEAVYSWQDHVRALKLRYPHYFEDPKLKRRAEKFCSFSFEPYLKYKHFNREFQNEQLQNRVAVLDELPF